MASSLGREKVAGVYAAGDVPDTGPVETLAEDLGVPAHLGHGDLADGTGELEEIVDRHRGETVVVVRGGSAMRPRLLLVDADGVVERPLDGPG